MFNMELNCFCISFCIGKPILQLRKNFTSCHFYTSDIRVTKNFQARQHAYYPYLVPNDKEGLQLETLTSGNRHER